MGGGGRKRARFNDTAAGSSGSSGTSDDVADTTARQSQSGPSTNRPQMEGGKTSNELQGNADVLRKISLPATVDLERFVSARKDELVNLSDAVKTRMRKLASQQLERHLRRRTVSHNKKRLPKRLQDRYNAEAAKVTKRPSRFHRRRPRNLQEEYTRRSKKHRWLETHLWHAKRFRMVEKFGYKIAESSFDKSLRACYRGAAKYCLLNDISYECCIELRGEFEAICGAVQKMSSQKTGLSVGAKKFINGRFEGSIWLYEIDAYPQKCLGEVSFMWRPPRPDNPERTLWIWCHPELRLSLITRFRKLLDLSEVANDSKEAADECLIFKGPVVTLTDRRDELNRFRLTGPLSVRVLCEALTQDKSGTALSPLFTHKPDYFNTFWTALGAHALSAFSYLRDGQIVGNVVLDPRLHMPTKRMVSTVINEKPDEDPTSTESGMTHDVFNSIPVESDIWDKSLRDFVKSSMMTQDQLNKLRHEKLIPGTPLDLGTAESRIPLLVVFRAGAQDILGYSRGCDIILPAGWARQFFIALNYRSGRPAGLRDLNAVTRYSGRFTFPDDIPDSIIASPHLAKETAELLAKHLRYPPNKRPPFGKLGVSRPYSMPFEKLLRSFLEVQPPEETPLPFYVVRDHEALKELSAMYRDPVVFIQVVYKLMSEAEIEKALLPVKIRCTKGVPERFARLYGLPSSKGPMQEPPHHVSVNERSVTMSNLTESDYSDGDGSNFYSIIGYLVSGDRNYTERTATGLGYVSLNWLMDTFQTTAEPVIAFRNQHCFNYHIVEMSILHN